MKPKRQINEHRLFFYKAPLVAATFEEVACLVSIPFLITCFLFQIIYIEIQKPKLLKDLYIFTRRDIRHLKQSNDILVGATIYTPCRDHAYTETEKKTLKSHMKWYIIRRQECLVGGRKLFSTLPKFLSTHMTRTCGYMLRGCIQLNV